MPAQSKAQQKFMGAVYALKKGDLKPSDASPEVRKVAKDMKKSDAKDFASTKHKGLPKKVKQEIARRLKDEGKLAGTMVGSYAIPSKAKKRKHGDSDNLGIRKKKGNSGQPDLEEGSSFQRNNSRKPPAPYGGLNHHILNKSSVRKHDDDANFPKKDSGHEDLDEAKVETERYFGKKGIIIMIRDGNKIVSAIFKDKKNADKFNRNKPADVKKLLQLAKKTKYPKAIDESINEILVIVDKFDKKKQSYGKIYYKDGGNRPNDGDLKKANKELERLSKKHKGLTLVSVGRNSKMYDVHNSRESVNECWDTHKQVGFKMKNGKRVPNCVPKNESKFSKKPEVNPKQLLKIQSDVRKINRKIKVYISKHPVTKGELSIELGAGHDNDAEIDKIYKVLKKHTGTHRTGSIFNESIAPNHDGKAAPYGSGYKKVDEDGKEISDKNYAQWKKSNKLKEWFSPNLTEEKIDELGIFPIKNYLKGMIPPQAIDTTTPQKRERLKSLIKDLVATLNDYWKSHKIPYRVKSRMKI